MAILSGIYKSVYLILLKGFNRITSDRWPTLCELTGHAISSQFFMHYLFVHCSKYWECPNILENFCIIFIMILDLLGLLIFVIVWSNWLWQPFWKGSLTRQYYFSLKSFHLKTVHVPRVSNIWAMSWLRKPAFCIYGKSKGADQLHGNHAANQRLRFRYVDSTITTS